MSPTHEESDRSAELMQRVVSLCKRRGFVFQSSEIYGGLRSAEPWEPPPLVWGGIPSEEA